MGRLARKHQIIEEGAALQWGAPKKRTSTEREPVYNGTIPGETYP
jgi:hypothetical protein